MDRLISVTIALLIVTSLVSCSKGKVVQQDEPFKLTKRPASLQPEPEPEPVVVPEAEKESGAIDIQVEPEVDATAEVPEPQPVQRQEAPKPPAAGGHKLRLEFDGECWVKVSGPDEDIYHGPLAAGDAKEFGPEEYFIVTLGKPENAAVYFDDELIYGGGKKGPTSLKFALPESASIHLPKPDEKPKEEPVRTTPPSTGAAGATGSGGKHTLRVDTAGECWLKVAGPERTLYQGLLAEGNSKDFGPERYFIITLGKPENARVFFDNQHIYGGEKKNPSSLRFALPAEASVYLAEPEEKPESEAAPAAPADVERPEGYDIETVEGGHMLRIDIKDECWVRVTGAKGVIYQALLQKGASKTLGPEDNFLITLGKPKNAWVFIDGKQVFGGDRGYPTTLTFSLPGEIDLGAAAGESGAPGQPAATPQAQPEDSPPASYMGWIETGQWALALKDYETAIQDFERAYEIAPNYVQVNMLLGKAHRGAGNLGTAIEYLNAALRLDANDADSLLEMAYAQEEKGNTGSAITYFEKYLAIYDSDDIREHMEELRGG